MLDWDGITTELQKPLDTKHVKPPKAFGPKGDYIEGWHAQDEANRIFGHGVWSQLVTETKCVAESPREIGKNKEPGFGVTYTAKVRIEIGEIVREDFGAGHGYDKDLGLAHESAIKEAATDAMKRALKSFGYPFGLALYDKTKANVSDVTAELKADEAIAGDREAIGMVESMEELQTTWSTINQTWKAQFNRLPPQALIDAKDFKKTEIQEKETA